MSKTKLAIASVIGMALFAFGCAGDADGTGSPKPKPSTGTDTDTDDDNDDENDDGNNPDDIKVAFYCDTAAFCEATTYDACTTKINSFLDAVSASEASEILDQIDFCSSLDCEAFWNVKDCWETITE